MMSGSIITIPPFDLRVAVADGEAFTPEPIPVIVIGLYPGPSQPQESEAPQP